MNPIPSPVFDDGIVFLTSGFRGNSFKAIKLDGAKGDITNTPAVAWTMDRDTPYVPSPLVYQGIVYFLKTNNGLLSAVDAKTGKPHYQVQRIEGVPNVFASPVGAAGKIFIVGREGTTAVIKPGAVVRGAVNQHARRSLRRVAGAGRVGDVSEGDEVPVFDRELTINSQAPNSKLQANADVPIPRVTWDLEVGSSLAIGSWTWDLTLSPGPGNPQTTPDRAPSGACRGRRSCPTALSSSLSS